ncbi:unnamed protein product [Linum tenue]|uniref:Large ribosomal subunit protein bL34c n=1 Tax=Linum tenue TaxID=586396 RepID=A0AAV0RLE5_9ROSI|nr:unnamed protein product [Linum tenue]
MGSGAVVDLKVDPIQLPFGLRFWINPIHKNPPHLLSSSSLIIIPSLPPSLIGITRRKEIQRSKERNEQAMAASVSIMSSPAWMPACRNAQSSPRGSVSASLSLSTVKRNFSMNAASRSTSRSGLLHCSFLSPPTSSFSGLSLGTVDLNSGEKSRKRGGGLVVRAGKAALCLTKRNRSRKSLARTHGFRRRMRTTSGRAILKRRRAKGRWVLCTKSNPNSGKAS